MHWIGFIQAINWTLVGRGGKLCKFSVHEHGDNAMDVYWIGSWDCLQVGSYPSMMMELGKGIMLLLHQTPIGRFGVVLSYVG